MHVTLSLQPTKQFYPSSPLVNPLLSFIPSPYYALPYLPLVSLLVYTPSHSLCPNQSKSATPSTACYLHVAIYPPLPAKLFYPFSFPLPQSIRISSPPRPLHPLFLPAPSHSTCTSRLSPNHSQYPLLYTPHYSLLSSPSLHTSPSCVLRPSTLFPPVSSIPPH